MTSIYRSSLCTHCRTPLYPLITTEGGLLVCGDACREETESEARIQETFRRMADHREIQRLLGEIRELARKPPPPPPPPSGSYSMDALIEAGIYWTRWLREAGIEV